MTSEGVKADGGKLRWSLLPWHALRQVVRVLEFGARKYAVNNWLKVEGGRVRYFDALERHFDAWMAGEVFDPESSLPHLAHIACNAMFLLTLDKAGDVPLAVLAERERCAQIAMELGAYFNGPFVLTEQYRNGHRDAALWIAKTIRGEAA